MAGNGWGNGRYARQLALDVLGEEGQKALAGSTVTVVGAGGLGSNSTELLVRMGFGRVRVIDGDIVERSNLHRVRLFGDNDVGEPKVDVLARRLQGLLSDSTVEAYHEDLRPDNALRLLGGSQVVLDGLDNMKARYLLNDACLDLGTPWVYGGVVATSGLVAPFPKDGPCLRCLFPEMPPPGKLPTTEAVGIHPSLPAVVSSVQVALATRIVRNALGSPRMLAMDLWTDDWRVVSLSRRTDCPACVSGHREFLEGYAGV